MLPASVRGALPPCTTQSRLCGFSPEHRPKTVQRQFCHVATFATLAVRMSQLCVRCHPRCYLLAQSFVAFPATLRTKVVLRRDIVLVQRSERCCSDPAICISTADFVAWLLRADNGQRQFQANTVFYWQGGCVLVMCNMPARSCWCKPHDAQLAQPPWRATKPYPGAPQQHGLILMAC